MNEKLYENFTTGERVDLVIAALARGDEAEIASLRRTCPRRTYTMLDRDFTQRLDALPWIAAHFQEVYNFYSNKITLSKACITIFSLMCDHPDHLNENQDEKITESGDALVRHVSHLKSLFTALSDFCSEIGLSYDHLVNWLNVDVGVIEHLVGDYYYSIADIDMEFSCHIKEQFIEIWNSSLV